MDNLEKHPSETVEHAPKRRRTTKASNSQIAALLAKIEAHPSLATRRFTGLQGKEALREAWRELSLELNIIENGSVKTPEQWMTVWRDLKSRACTKAAKLRKERVQTGNREVQTPSLTELEKRIVAVIGADYTVGSSCPDSMPEENISQIQLEAGVIGEPLDIVIEVADETLPLSSSEINLPAEEEMPAEEEIPAEEAMPAEQAQARGETRINSNENNPQTRRSRNRNLNPRRSVSEQMSSARADFLAVAQTNADSMQVLAAAAKMQAEAAKMQAEATILFAQAANKLADAILLIANKK